jgi:hypothetical protein
VAAATLPRRLAVFVIAATAAFLLAGCMQLHVDMTVSAHDTISGQVRFGLEKSLLAAFGGAGELQQTLAAQSSCDPVHAKQSSYDDSTYAGVVCTYTDVPIAQFGKGGRDPSSGLSLTRVGADYRLSGSIDLTKLANSASSGIPIDPTLLSSADVRLRFTFPGPITSSTGTVSGRTVTFTPDSSGKITVQATAKARGDSGSVSAFGIGVAIAAGAAAMLIAVVVWMVLARRRHRPVAAGPPQEQLAAAWNPELAGVPAGEPADPNAWAYPPGAEWQRSLGPPATYPGTTSSPPPGYGYAAPPPNGYPTTPTAPPGPGDRW